MCCRVRALSQAVKVCQKKSGTGNEKQGTWRKSSRKVKSDHLIEKCCDLNKLSKLNFWGNYGVQSAEFVCGYVRGQN